MTTNMYDPLELEQAYGADEHDNARPCNHFARSSFFQEWPNFPNQVVKYGKYYLKWSFGLVTTDRYGHNLYRPQQGVLSKISVDQHTWLSFSELYWGSYRNNSSIPTWFDRKELEAEVEKVEKEFMRLRRNAKAKERRAALKAEAEARGISFEKARAQAAKERKEKQTKQRNRKTAKKLAKQTNKKMKVAMVLKELMETAQTLQDKIEDTEIELRFAYMDTRIDRVKTAIEALEQLSEERN